MAKCKDVMIDIETLGNKPYSVILSIAAVCFDMHTGKLGKTFYMKIDPESCTDAGLKIDASTVLWWMQQSEAARKEAVSSQGEEPIDVVLKKLSKFFHSLGTVRVWANSPSFDCSRIREAYQLVLKADNPWSFRMQRDYRTVVSLVPVVVKKDAELVAHNAYDDCIYQINNLLAAVRTLGIRQRY